MAKMDKDKYLLLLCFIIIVLMFVSITNHLTVPGSILAIILLIYVIGFLYASLSIIFPEFGDFLDKKPFKRNYYKDKKKNRLNYKRGRCKLWQIRILC